jgi:hypothetical protein
MRRFASVAALPAKGMRDSISASKKALKRIVAAEAESQSSAWSCMAAMQAEHWSFASQGGVWMRPERKQETQLVVQQVWSSETTFQPRAVPLARAAPPVIRLPSALLLPMLSLPLTHCEHCKLRLQPHQHAVRLHLLDDSRTPLLFEFLFSNHSCTRRLGATATKSPAYHHAFVPPLPCSTNDTGRKDFSRNFADFPSERN